MIDYSKIITNPDDLEFLFEIRDTILVEQCCFTLTCDYCSFRIELAFPQIEIWHYGKVIASFDSVDDFFMNFTINGKKFLDLLPDLEFDC